MYNLLRFIQKHHFVILFLVLEVLCVVMLTMSQSYHRQKRINTTNDIVGKIYQTGTRVGDYFRLGKINTELAEENAMLRRQLAVVTDTTQGYQEYINADTIYNFIPARVVNSTVNRPNNYIMIDKGRADGIEKDMGVVSPDGIVGIVTDVSAHYASVMSLLHSYSTISVRLKNNDDQLTTLRWETTNYRYGTVDGIPTHLRPQKGDTVVTSSYSFIFPENLMAGTVEELIPSPSGTLNQAKIKYSTDFASLKIVYVIQHTNKAELDSLRLHQQDL
ncbi:MAG: rod shape-determining protein MreC [Bacteroidales bacterium]|nr:rod shape-determining protein MreC [Bacteroidales bacterium]